MKIAYYRIYHRMNNNYIKKQRINVIDVIDVIIYKRRKRVVKIVK